MCIRDRRELDHESDPGHVPRARLLLQHVPGPAGGARGRRACLLYTSDAADERSSVDLGGRRIIKQKNDRRRRRDTDRQSIKSTD